MAEPIRPVIVFHGRSEFEAQMARDTLQSAMVPVLHVPSLSTGIFGVRQSTRVAVPGRHAEEAIRVLRDAGFAAGEQEMPRGLDAFTDTFRNAFPDRKGDSSLLRILLLVAGGALLWFLLRRLIG